MFFFCGAGGVSGTGTGDGGTGQGLFGSRLGWGAFMLAWAAFLGATYIRDLLTFAMEAGKEANAVPFWHYATWEATSRVGWVVAFLLMLLAFSRFRPARLGWPRALAGHALAVVAASLLHVAAMVGLRVLLHAAAGEAYSFGPFPLQLAYEFQKDVLSYGIALGMVWLMARAFPARPPAASATAEPAGQPDPAPAPPPDLGEGPVFAIRERWGSKDVPASTVLRAEAAGNYVELVTAEGRYLHRTTLLKLEEELRPLGFVRVHRGHLLSRGAVARVQPTPSGDAVAILCNGDEVPVSRRYRGALGDGVEPSSANATT